MTLLSILQAVLGLLAVESFRQSTTPHLHIHRSMAPPTSNQRFELKMLKEVQKFTRRVPQLNPDGLRNIAKEINSAPSTSANAPQLTDLDVLEAAQQTASEKTQVVGSGIDKSLEQATRMIGKSSTASLQAFIYRLNTPALAVSKPKTTDFEELASASLDLAWRRSGGDWQKMLALLDAELGEGVAAADVALSACVEACNSLTESELKALIVRLAPEGVNALPKLDKKKYEGKFLHCDYVAQLIDVVRLQNGNDYVACAAVLGKHKKRKGFA